MRAVTIAAVSRRAELASLNELIQTGSGGNGARSPLLITTSRLPD